MGDRLSARVLSVAMSAFLIVSCSAANPSAIAVPTLAPDPAGSPQACMAALIEGTLRSNDEWGIALETIEGATVRVLWPYGYSARVEDGRLVLLDDGGTVVAREGDLVQVGGGGSEPDGTWIGCGGVTVVDAE